MKKLVLCAAIAAFTLPSLAMAAIPAPAQGKQELAPATQIARSMDDDHYMAGPAKKCNIDVCGPTAPVVRDNVAGNVWMKWMDMASIDIGSIMPGGGGGNYNTIN